MKKKKDVQIVSQVCLSKTLVIEAIFKGGDEKEKRKRERLGVRKESSSTTLQPTVC